MERRAKVELFEQIRREYEFGVGSIKGVAAKLGVHRRMVRQALSSAEPPERKPVERVLYGVSRRPWVTTILRERDARPAPDLVEQNCSPSGQVGQNGAIEGESDCVGSQMVRCVTHRVHRLWERRKNPACGLVGNAPMAAHVGRSHETLQRVRFLSMAFKIVMSLRMQATSATFLALPRPSSRR